MTSEPVPNPNIPDPQAVEAEQPPDKKQVITNWLLAVGALGVMTYFKPELARYLFFFVVTLSVLVFVHEWGHYQFARWAGMKVNRFGIGFPPWIANVRRNGIDYSIGALPIGGMVDIAGLGSEEEMVATAKGVTVVEEPKPAAKFGEKNFQDASLGWRFMTLFAGPMMNFIFALVVFSIVYTAIGVPDRKVTNKVDLVYPGTPADKAGVHSGDILVSVSGVKTNDPMKLREMIVASNARPVQIEVQREGKILQRTLTPQMEDQLLQNDKMERNPVIGIKFDTPITGYQKVGLLHGVLTNEDGEKFEGFQFGAIGLGLTNAYSLTEQIFALLRRVVTARLTQEDKRNLGGPVKIAQSIGHTSKKTGLDLILMAASLSINLGIMNLLPIPALDGGRIMFLGYEFVLRRRVDPRRETLVNSVGMLMVLAFMLFMTLRDVLPFLKIQG